MDKNYLFAPNFIRQGRKNIITMFTDNSNQRRSKILNYLKQINVELSERSYPIIIGNDSLSKLASRINSLHLSKCLIIADKNLIKYHNTLIRKIFAMLDCKIFNYIFIANENNKSL